MEDLGSEGLFCLGERNFLGLAVAIDDQPQSLPPYSQPVHLVERAPVFRSEAKSSRNTTRTGSA